MAFSQAELDSIAVSLLDFYYRGKPIAQSIQDKPNLLKLTTGKKNLPGGKGDIAINVKGNYRILDSSGNPVAAGVGGRLKGYSHDDPVDYGRIADIQQAKYAWKELTAGWNMTFTELKMNGLSVTDSAVPDGTSAISDREKQIISDLMLDKIESFDEISMRDMNEMFYRATPVTAKSMYGIAYFISDVPAVGVTGGIDRALNPWWRNKAVLGIATPGVSVALVVHSVMRQLRRYGGRPDTFLAGSDFLDALVAELYGKGEYTNIGWSKPSTMDISIAEISYNGMKIQYDPTLDDLGASGVIGNGSKRMYVYDSRDIYVHAMEGEWERDHAPARPTNVYALYKSRTYTGQLVARRLNSSAVFSIA